MYVCTPHAHAHVYAHVPVSVPVSPTYVTPCVVCRRPTAKEEAKADGNHVLYRTAYIHITLERQFFVFRCFIAIWQVSYYRQIFSFILNPLCLVPQISCDISHLILVAVQRTLFRVRAREGYCFHSPSPLEPVKLVASR